MTSGGKNCDGQNEMDTKVKQKRKQFFRMEVIDLFSLGVWRNE
jgi:hypothetical protein